MVVLSATVNASETPMADTIKTGTTLIEEGTLMLESLQFESEPWTSFYRPVESFENCGRRLEKKTSTGAKATRLIRTM